MFGTLLLVVFLSFLSLIAYLLFLLYQKLTFPQPLPYRTPTYRKVEGKEGKKRRVAIIGAGPSGLTSIKACLEEGQEPVCFEQSHDIGGLWRFSKGESHSSVMESTIINTSKEIMSYSDFPVPDSWPTFLPQALCFKYFQEYAKEFELLKYIHFNSTVKKIIPIPETGKHKVVIVSHGNKEQEGEQGGGEEREEEFDAVMVCSGHHWQPHRPHFAGEERFKGKILHSHYYKTPYPDFLEAKNFLVVGIGNSGVDIGVELSRVGQTYLSTRRGSWIVGRHSFFGQPLDHMVSRFITSVLPTSFLNAVAKFQSFFLWGRLEKVSPHLKPKHEPFSSHVTVHSELVGRCQTGRLMIKPNIKEIKENSVVFEDGSEVEVEVIVLCTGYSISYPFFDDHVLKFHNNYHPVYKLILPLNSTYKSDSAQHQLLSSSSSSSSPQSPEDILIPNLGLFGLIQPAGAIMPLSELQARWFVQYLIGAISLPPPQDVVKEIQERKRKMRERYYESNRHTIQVDYLPYAESLGQDFDLTFNFWEVKEKYGLPFALKWLFKFASPVQFRLKGPHSWPSAKQHLEAVWERI